MASSPRQTSYVWGCDKEIGGPKSREDSKDTLAITCIPRWLPVLFQFFSTLRLDCSEVRTEVFFFYHVSLAY